MRRYVPETWGPSRLVVGQDGMFAHRRFGWTALLTATRLCMAEVGCCQSYLHGEMIRCAHRHQIHSGCGEGAWEAYHPGPYRSGFGCAGVVRVLRGWRPVRERQTGAAAPRATCRGPLQHIK
jgi:hypothetical protein